MPPFRFRLAKVLDWYTEQCGLEENRLRDRAAALEKCRTEFVRAREARLATERDLLGARALPASELLALARYRRRAVQSEQRLREQIAQREREWQEQLAVVREARRRVRLLEKVRERRLQEHTASLDRELEQLAADAFRAVHAGPLTFGN